MSHTNLKDFMTKVSKHLNRKMWLHLASLEAKVEPRRLEELELEFRCSKQMMASMTTWMTRLRNVFFLGCLRVKMAVRGTCSLGIRLCPGVLDSRPRLKKRRENSAASRGFEFEVITEVRVRVNERVLFVSGKTTPDVTRVVYELGQ